MAVSSPLASAYTNVIDINKTRSQMRSSQQSFQSFSNFLFAQRKSIEAVPLPSKRKIKKLANIDVANTFGRPGNLLGGLVSGALDVAGFISGMFGGGRNPKAGKPVPSGGKIKFGGVKALGIANAAFAGLDFATGLSEGESVGKAAAGAGGSLAGSLLGGAIGQTLIPVPGVGFVIGSMAGGFLGGYLGDRAYEGVTGEGTESYQQRKIEESKAAALAKASTGTSFSSVVDKFDSTVTQFEKLAYSGFLGNVPQTGVIDEYGTDIMEDDNYGDRQNTPSTLDGKFQEFEASGGSLPSSKAGSPYGERFHPIYKVNKMHYGIDYPLPEGTKISVIQPGKVADAGFRDNGYGNQIKVDHPGGMSSFYAHLSEINVKQGQDVSPGTVIGAVGNTGTSTGPHLHFEVDAGGSRVDPTPYQDQIFRFGGDIKVKSKASAKTGLMGETPQAKKLTEDEFHAVRADRDISDKADIRVGSTDTYEDYLKYFEENKDKIAAATVEPETSTPEVPSTTPSTRPDRRSQAASRRRELQSSDLTTSTTQQPTPQQVQTVQPVQQQRVMPQQVEEYPEYDEPEVAVQIVPVIIDSGNMNQSSAPIIIPTASGKKSITIPRATTSVTVNNFLSKILLTTLSGS